ncbi:Protein CHLOROPLAST J-LIKE DOMAIN 1, chloroplastic [Linum perenne]
MKIKEANAGIITNCELLDMLKSRGAAKDTTRVIAPVAPSEYKVYDYLVGTVACNQTREQINEFLEKSKKYKLAKAEILSIINTRPSQLVELDPLIEQQEQRPEIDMEELVELILQVLPPHPVQPEAEETEDNVPIVSKDVKYADKMPIIPWGPRFTKSSQKDMQINLAISAVFTAWILIKRNAAYKPLQFLAFAFVYRLFEKLKATEPAVSPTLTEDGEDDGKGLRMGKRLLRSLALSFGCIAFASLAYTCILNVIEYTSGFIPIVLYNNQAAFTSIVDFASLLARSLSLLIFPRTSFQSSLNAILQETVIVKKRLRDEDVYDYLVGTVACNQTREQINEFLEKSKKYKLAKAEILSIINTRPSQLVELDPLIEQQEQRPEIDMEELVELILQVLPPHPVQPEAEETEDNVPIVSKDVKYADKMPIIPWGPRFTKSSQKDMQINLAISAVFTAWILIKRNAAYKPLQFLAFAFVYRLFEKLKATEPAVSPTLTEDGEDDGKGLRMGKRLLRSLALSFGCIAFASLAYTCILNVIEYTSGFIPIVLYNNQEPIITAVSAVSLYILASYYR